MRSVCYQFILVAFDVFQDIVTFGDRIEMLHRRQTHTVMVVFQAQNPDLEIAAADLYVVHIRLLN